MTEGMMAYEAFEYLHQILALVEQMAGFGDHIVGDPVTYARIIAPLSFGARACCLSGQKRQKLHREARISFKKTLHAAEQDRADVAQARERWKADQPKLDTQKLVFIDETGANTKMTRAYGRCPIGQRLVCKTPWGHWKTTTSYAACAATAS